MTAPIQALEDGANPVDDRVLPDGWTGSKIAEVVDDASALICGEGKVEHLWTTCLRNGARNVHSNPPCTACQINAIAAVVRQARHV